MQKSIGILALVAVMVLSGSNGRAADEFYVIGGGGGAVGTKITSVPCIIENPGFYYLGKNLTYSGDGNAITINTDNVTLDLMGCSLTYDGSHDDPNGIYLNGRKNVEIRNGSISGFWTAVFEASVDNGANHRVFNIRADYNTIEGGIGILLFGKNHLVQDCSGSNNNFAGIYIGSGTISGCVASNNSSQYGFDLNGSGSLLDNVAHNNKYGFQFGATEKVLVDGNSAQGNSTNYSAGGAGTTWGVNAGR